MKFLLAQINPVVGDLEGNAKKILNIASKANSISADFVLTPELSLWGYPANDLLLKNNLIKGKIGKLEKIIITSRDPAAPSPSNLPRARGRRSGYN